MQFQDQQPVAGESNAQGEIELVQTLKSPKLWSAEHPNLYDLALDLKDAIGQIDRALHPPGRRARSLDQGRHSSDQQRPREVHRHVPARCVIRRWALRSMNEVWRKTSADEGRQHQCDSHEPLSVWLEASMTFATRLGCTSWTRWRPAGRRPTRMPCAGLCAACPRSRAARQESSLVSSSGRSETKTSKGKNNKVAADEIRKIDPTRPRLVSWRTAEDSGVEFDDLHYTTPAKIAARQSRTAPGEISDDLSWKTPTTGKSATAPTSAALDRWARSSIDAGRRSGRTSTSPAHSSGNGAIAPSADQCSDQALRL